MNSTNGKRSGRRIAKPGRIRIIGGEYRGRRIAVPERSDLRPTPDRVRETLFNWLGQRLDGLRCLDLFAGSGALGFEALSRGAARVVLVDRDAAAVAAARENARALEQASGEVQVFRQDATTAIEALADEGRLFDVVYLDPPYASELYEPLVALVGARLLAEGGVVVAEHFHKRALPERIGALARTRQKRVGDHCLSFYAAVAQGAGDPAGD